MSPRWPSSPRDLHLNVAHGGVCCNNNWLAGWWAACHLVWNRNTIPDWDLRKMFEAAQKRLPVWRSPHKQPHRWFIFKTDDSTVIQFQLAEQRRECRGGGAARAAEPRTRIRLSWTTCDGTRAQPPAAVLGSALLLLRYDFNLCITQRYGHGAH